MGVAKTKAAMDCHIIQALSDPECIEELRVYREAKKGDPQQFTSVLKSFGIEVDDLGNDFEQHINPDSIFSAGTLTYKELEGRFVVSFKPDIKKYQFEELWNLIKKNRAQLRLKESKLKPPEYPELLYAIYRALSRGCTFHEINTLYQSSSLPLFNGKPTNKFLNAEDLSGYYYRFYRSDFK
jgi:hypothetical protein